jgi:hypothetical protein
MDERTRARARAQIVKETNKSWALVATVVSVPWLAFFCWIAFSNDFKLFYAVAAFAPFLAWIVYALRPAEEELFGTQRAATGQASVYAGSEGEAAVADQQADVALPTAVKPRKRVRFLSWRSFESRVAEVTKDYCLLFTVLDGTDRDFEREIAEIGGRTWRELRIRTWLNRLQGKSTQSAAEEAEFQRLLHFARTTSKLPVPPNKDSKAS